jgi:hypothetical protein
VKEKKCFLSIKKHKTKARKVAKKQKVAKILFCCQKLHNKQKCQC